MTRKGKENISQASVKVDAITRIYFMQQMKDIFLVYSLYFLKNVVC